MLFKKDKTPKNKVKDKKEDKPQMTTKERSQLNKDVANLIDEWTNVMTHTNTFNSDMDTFEISDEVKTEYGWHFRLFCPWGLTFDKLVTLTPIIKHNMKCHFSYEVVPSNAFAVCDIIYEHMIKINDVPFEPVKVKPWQFYLGNKINGKPVIADMNTHPFILLAGQTGRGKNGSLNHGLISLIHSCTKEQIRLLYYQAAKGDGIIYKNCEQTYAWASYDLGKLLQMCLYCEEQIQIRTKLFEPMMLQFKGDNILAYNKMHKQDQLPYIYLVIDEFLAVNPEKGDADKEIKELILNVMKGIGQYGRSSGVTYVVAHQKPEKELCPTFLKNMSNTRVCFGYEDNICSQIVLGNDLAKGLPPRRAYGYINGKLELIFTTNLDGRMQPYLKPHYKTNRRDLFEDLKKVQKFHHAVDVKSKTNDKNVESKGKEDIKKENENKKQLEELERREQLLKEREELAKAHEIKLKQMELKLKDMEDKQAKIIHDQKYNYDNVDPNNATLENNISKIPNYVPWESKGKEKIK